MRNDVTRFNGPGGLTTARELDPLVDFGMPDPTKWVIFFEDFVTMGTFTVTTNTSWTITKTEAGAGSAAIARIDGFGGLMAITNDAADNDNFFAQTIGEQFRWSASKRLIFDCRFKVSDAVDSDVVIGLQLTDTTPLDVTDGIFFIKDDDAATVSFRVEKDNAASTLAVGSLTSDTFARLSFVYNGVPRDVSGTATYDFQVFLNGALVGTVAATTNVPDDEDLCISFGIQNGAAVAKVLTIDYVFCAQERNPTTGA